MKTLLITLITGIISFVIMPTQVDAKPPQSKKSHSSVYRNGHTTCGCAKYVKRVVVSYDRHHHPVYRYYSVPVTHKCRTQIRHTSSRSPYVYSSYRSYRQPYRSSPRISFSTSNGRISICR
ncbi:MAG: hypothetical protein ACSHX0_01430 [Akkermansiaceae bacterium]